MGLIKLTTNNCQLMQVNTLESCQNSLDIRSFSTSRALERLKFASWILIKFLEIYFCSSLESCQLQIEFLVTVKHYLINANMVKIIACAWIAQGIPGHMSFCS